MCRLTAAVQIHAVQGTTVNLLNGLFQKSSLIGIRAHNF